MLRASLVCAAVTVCAVPIAGAQQPARPDGWVVIPVEEYRALRLKAFPPDRPPDPPPVEATVTRVEYDLRVTGDSASGEARLTVDVLKEGWVRGGNPGRTARARCAGRRPRGIADRRAPSPHVLLSKPGRAVLSLDVVVPLARSRPPRRSRSRRRRARSRGSRWSCRGKASTYGHGRRARRSVRTQPEGRWVAFGRRVSR